MMPSRPRLTVFVAAITLALLAWITPFVPPFPIPGWIVGGYVVGPFEHWWYSLPDGSRSKVLYDVGTSIGAGVYPLLVALIFWLWCTPLRRGENPYPKRTPILALAAVLLSVTYFLVSWRYGLRYQGLSTVLFYIALNALALAVLSLGWIQARRRSSWLGSLVVHWGLFAWLCAFAFPWLGEMI
jgi:hypothetical protein